jgi:hypothetical protein
MNFPREERRGVGGCAAERSPQHTERNRWLLVIQPVRPFDVNVTYIHATGTQRASPPATTLSCAALASIFTCYQYANLLNLNLIYTRVVHGDPEWAGGTDGKVGLGLDSEVCTETPVSECGVPLSMSMPNWKLLGGAALSIQR